MITKGRFNIKKVKVKLYLAGNQFAATAEDEVYFVDKCYDSTPEMAKELALDGLKQLYNTDLHLQNKYKNKNKLNKELAR